MPGRRSQLTRLDFTRGMNDSVSPSTLPPNQVAELRNWIVEPSGVLRTPRAFRTASQQGLVGAARVARGISGYVDPTLGKQVILATAEDATTYSIRSLPRSDLSAASWGGIESVTASETDLPVAFASGAGRLLYASPAFSSGFIRSWDGTSAAAVESTGLAGRALLFYQNRFWGGGHLSEPTDLVFTDIGDPTAWTGTQPISATDGEPIEDLAAWDRALWIGKESSIWYMTGGSTTNFAWRPADGGGVAPGRTLVPTPLGIMAIGPERVYMMTGGGFEPISQPIEGSYGMTGDYMTGAYINGVLYVCDNGSATIWRFDTTSGVWSVYDADEADESPAHLFADNTYLYGGTLNSASNSPLMYRAEPGEDRGRLDHAGQTFRMRTGELWLAGAQREWTALNLHLALRQPAIDLDPPTLNVNVYNQELEVVQNVTIEPEETAQTYRYPVSIGVTGYGLAIELEQILTINQEAVYDIENAELEWEPTSPR